MTLLSSFSTLFPVTRGKDFWSCTWGISWEVRPSDVHAACRALGTQGVWSWRAGLVLRSLQRRRLPRAHISVPTGAPLGKQLRRSRGCVANQTTQSQPALNAATGLCCSMLQKGFLFMFSMCLSVRPMRKTALLNASTGNWMPKQQLGEAGTWLYRDTGLRLRHDGDRFVQKHGEEGNIPSWLCKLPHMLSWRICVGTYLQNWNSLSLHCTEAEKKKLTCCKSNVTAEFNMLEFLESVLMLSAQTACTAFYSKEF